MWFCGSLAHSSFSHRLSKLAQIYRIHTCNYRRNDVQNVISCPDTRWTACVRRASDSWLICNLQMRIISRLEVPKVRADRERGTLSMTLPKSAKGQVSHKSKSHCDAKVTGYNIQWDGCLPRQAHDCILLWEGVGSSGVFASLWDGVLSQIRTPQHRSHISEVVQFVIRFA